MAKQKNDLNQNFLDVINTEEKAYFLGFFYADGYNNEKQGRIVISIQEKDVEILEQFKKMFYRNDKKLYLIPPQHRTPNNMISLSIGSKYLSQRMKELGAPQKKSYLIRFPFWLDENLWKHFIRGYFDGDGSIGKFKQDDCVLPTFNVRIAGNFEFIVQLKTVLNLKTGLDFKICSIGNKGTFTTWLNGKKSEQFLDWLYSESKIKLNRKFKLFEYIKFVRNQKNIKNENLRYTFFDNGRWYGRLPLRFKRKLVGGFLTEEEAFLAVKNEIKEYGVP